MGFFSFMGRVLFASIFIISAWQMFNDFGEDGGPAATELAPKLGEIRELVFEKVGVKLPEIEVRQLVATSLAVKGLGGVLFVFGSTFGAYLLMLHLALTTPFLYDFYNYGPNQPEFFSTLKEFLLNAAVWCPAFLSGNEKHNAEEAATEEEDSPSERQRKRRS